MYKNISKVWHSQLPALLQPSIRALQSSSRKAEVSHHTVAVGDHSLHYVQAGTGPYTCLCMPGALGTGENDFGPQLSGLAGAEVRLLAWDPPGYGKSRPPNRQFSPDFLREDAHLAAQMMEKLGHNQYGLLGWSDGGISAIILAANNKRAVNRLVVFGANAFVTQEDVNIYTGIRDVSTWSARMRAPMEELYGVEGFRSLWEQWVDTLALILQQKDGDLCRSDCSDVQCPTLVIHGNKDPVVPISHPQYLEKAIKTATVKYMEDGKHNLHMKYAKEFNKMVLEFLTFRQQG